MEASPRHRTPSVRPAFLVVLLVPALVLILAPAGMADPGPAGKSPGLLAKLYWDRAVLRADREETLWLYLEDRGGVSGELDCRLILSPEVDLLSKTSDQKIPISAWVRREVRIGGDREGTVLEPQPSTRVCWRLKAEHPWSGTVGVEIRGASETFRCEVPADFRQHLEVKSHGYVPEPRAAVADRQIGMINCPLWKPGAHWGWHLLERSAPWRRPVLGWYDESQPEVIDWEIKWLVEHGVDFIMYCWYREFGNEGQPLRRKLDHAIHSGFFHARYADQIKFCLMWTNNDYSGVASREDLLTNLLPVWIETYFKQPNYLKLDNKPVLAVYHLRRLMKDLGGEEGVREALDLMRQACQQAGFDGLWLLCESRHWWSEPLETIAACGFDASFAYTWNNVPDGASDETAVETILSTLKNRAAWNRLPDVPTVSAMWDPSVWEQYFHPEDTSAHYHMSPEGFRKLCQGVQELTAQAPANSLAKRLLLVDNWNEWGEGHYLAPCREHGFQYLEALRSVFAPDSSPPDHRLPEEVGRGPYYEEAYEKWLNAANLKSSSNEPCQEEPEQMNTSESESTRSVQVACYYFPNYHPTDRRNIALKGEGWSEWELVRNAKPRFDGHLQPNIPAWGYTNEANPSAMARKIQAASEHGIDAFIFDWYWYDDGPFLEQGLESGFLQAENNADLKFALMWANHDWIDIHPARRDQAPALLYPGIVTPETFDTVCDYVIEKYFKHPSYWLIDGCPYFSVYEMNKLLASLGGLEGTRMAFDRFRSKVKEAGFPDLHLNMVFWNQPILPGEQGALSPAKLVSDLGFDSVTSYVWIHHVSLPEIATDYAYVQEKYFEYWDQAVSTFPVPYFPNVTMGWDSSPRAAQSDPFEPVGYPFMGTISGNTPERFRAALAATRDRLQESDQPQIININCWNEWTEGSYLEPDTRNGMAYLEAVRDVFGSPPGE